MSEVPRGARNVRPASTARLLESRTAAELSQALGSAIALVRIPEGDATELEQSLVASLDSPGTALPATLGFRTVAEVTPSLRTALAIRNAFDPRAIRETLRRFLASHVAVVVPLRKREGSGKEHIGRISIGRAVNNDIVLRHESISKLHAWLEKDEEGGFHVTDAGSRNGTYLNDVRVAPRASLRVHGGVELRLAAIPVRICTAQELWDALRPA